MYVGSQRYGGTGMLYEISGPFRPDQATVFPDPTATPTPQPHRDPPPTRHRRARASRSASRSRSGWPRRRSSATASRSASRSDKPATVRVRITAKIGNRTKTLATVTRSAKTGRSMWRIKASKSGAKLLKSRRKDVKATVEIRVTTPGAPVRTFNRTVTLRQ